VSAELERRAVAAEKTVDVLKRKVVALYNGDTSAMHRQVEAAKLREAENKKKRELAEIRAGELARYSQTLEVEVARRTAAIKTILDHVTFGFLVVGRDLVVKDETTRSCVGLFETSDVEGRRLGELLQLDKRREEQFLLSCDQVFEDLLPEEVSLGQLPQKFELAGGKMLRAEGSVIRDAEGGVAGVLFTISDITALEEATRESHTNRTLVGILRQKESFRSFLIEVRQQLAAARAALGDQALVRRVVHTIKGNSASYGLGDVVDLAQRIEDRREIDAGALDELTDGVRRFLAKNRGVLEIDFDELGEQSFELTSDQLSQFRGIVAKMGGGTPELRDWTARVLAKPARQLLGPITDFGARLAERLGKKLDFDLEGGDAVVDVETMRPVLASIAHLVRNAIDHGLEPPHLRGAKAAEGRLRVRISDPHGTYRVEVEDDGRGIDLARVTERAIERGFATREAIAGMSDGGLSLIFVDGLSTASEVTSVSGRGIGMSAVRSAVDRALGTIAIESKRGEGTKVIVDIPKPGTAGGAP
jgi:two-component system chemotaxis sensor kinase CheA